MPSFFVVVRLPQGQVGYFYCFFSESGQAKPLTVYEWTKVIVLLFGLRRLLLTLPFKKFGAKSLEISTNNAKGHIAFEPYLRTVPAA